MTLRHYHIFVTVCDEMSMTSAAETLFVSQSAVSQAIAEMERHYGVKLFERLSRKLYITYAGKKLLNYARHIISLNKNVENDMSSLNERSLIRIGASVTIGACVLPGLVSSFSSYYPKIQVKVVEDNTSKIQQLIAQDKIDMGIVEGEVSLPDIVSRPFAKDYLVLICGKNHRFCTLKSIKPSELKNEKFILRETGSGTRKTFENAMSERGLSWTEIWTCNNADTIKAAVAEGLGVSVISQRAVAKEIEEGRLFSIPIEGISFVRDFKIIYHKNKYITESMHKFWDACFNIK